MQAIVGLGQTGLSVLRYFVAHNIPCVLCDSRAAPPGIETFKQNFSTVPAYFGDLPAEVLLTAEQIILSPGLARTTPIIAQALAQGIPVVGDIELFVQQAQAPIIAITGTNAKGTVTTMLGSILNAAGLQVLLGGNIGIPALDLLTQATPDYYVLELSSFQLESTFSLQAAAATILNISDDHLDYHGTLTQYVAAKQRIYHGAQTTVACYDDPHTYPTDPAQASQCQYFGVGAPHATQTFGIVDGALRYRSTPIMPIQSLKVFGQHNAVNALAASALARNVGISWEAIRMGLENFSGLPHRCEYILSRAGVDWYNDSKGTNVGATLAALAGLGPTVNGRIVLIAGGQAKNQDFSPLCALCNQYVKTLILFGQDAKQLQQALQESVPEVILVKDLAEATQRAAAVSQSGDIVLLSPACASLDMFKDYAARGDQFKKLVLEIK